MRPSKQPRPNASATTGDSIVLSPPLDGLPQHPDEPQRLHRAAAPGRRGHAASSRRPPAPCSLTGRITTCIGPREPKSGRVEWLQCPRLIAPEHIVFGDVPHRRLPAAQHGLDRRRRGGREVGRRRRLPARGRQREPGREPAAHGAPHPDRGELLRDLQEVERGPQLPLPLRRFEEVQVRLAALRGARRRAG